MARLEQPHERARPPLADRASVDKARLALLGTLTERLRVEDEEELARRAFSGLRDGTLGVPLALLYLVEPEEKQVHLLEEAGEAAAAVHAPLVVSLEETNGSDLGKVVAHVAEQDEPELFTMPPYALLALPVRERAAAGAHLVLVGGVDSAGTEEAAAFDFLRALASLLSAALIEAHTSAHAREVSQLEREAKTNEHLYKRAAEAAQKSRDDFLLTLSHELRTPLQAILGWSQLLATRRLSGELYWHAIRSIERNTRWQAQLIEDLLDISQAVAGRMRLNIQPSDLRMVIDAAMEAVLAAAELKGVRLEIDVPTGPRLPLDPDRMQQVVWNLLSNAVKFTPRGGAVLVRVRYESGAALLEVSDTGEGMAPDVLANLFVRFWQAEGTTTRAHGGLGLGLAIVRHIVELHGGTIEAFSEGKGEGSTFLIRLPMLEAA